jgi:hypothetical protein
MDKTTENMDSTKIKNTKILAIRDKVRVEEKEEEHHEGEDTEIIS